MIFGLNPYDVQEAIEAEYRWDHRGQDVLYGQWTWLPGALRAKPDIFNRSLHLYNEIKPLSWSGLASGGSQLLLRAAQFGPLGPTDPPYYPDWVWPMTPASPYIYRFIRVGTDRVLFFNAAGILFYTNVDEMARDTVFATGTALTFLAVRELLRRYTLPLAYTSVRSALAYCKFLAYTAGAADEAQLESDVASGALIAAFGVL
jgi:hypothetical protein